MRLRTPSRTTRWWQRWFRRTSAGIPYHASDAVVAARLARTVTIATALITALVGITGTVTTAALSYKTSAQRLASENEKSATEFLRSQRQAVYTAFAAEAYATVQALVDANFLFLPSRPPPPLEDFNRVNRDVQSHLEKLNAAGLNLELVASEDVCNAGVNEYRALSNASEQHVRAAGPYVTGEIPPDDRYSKVRMTDKDTDALAKLFKVFTRAAREDLSDPALRKPAKNCP
jgi:hypothetical protein